MIVSWSPVVIVDIAGSLLVLLISCGCALYSWQLTRQKPDDVFRSYLFLFTLAILFFAVSRSFGHLVKQLLLMNDMEVVWRYISPFSGAVNSTAFVVIFAFSLSFHRFQKVHSEIEYYKNNLEELIDERTEELEKSRNTLENILNNSNPINITGVNFDLVQANEAYYALWPRVRENGKTVKCYESRPGDHCDTDQCPLKLIIAGHEEVVQEVSKDLNGEIRDFIVTARPFRGVDGTLLGMVESFQDITLRKQAEKAMRESEERFRMIFAANPDPVILTRLKDGVIIDINHAFEAATGISRLEALGHNADDLNLWADKNFRRGVSEKLHNFSEVENEEADFRVKGGQVKTGLVSACTLNLKNEPYVLLAIRDITTEKAAEQALIEMSRMKSEFISTAAHELNTPLSSMMGYAELLQNTGEFGAFSEEQKLEFVNEIYDNGEALSRIIDDLLDISRIESGNPIPLMLQKTDLMEVLDKKIKAFMAKESGHIFYLDLPDSPEQPIFPFDRHRINQVLDNLLSNAVKYSAEGGEIVLRGREVENGWEIRVEDQGVGMSEEQVKRIFEKFYRADSSNTTISGLGLGMSIVKQIMEAHGGKIRVESCEGAGTTAIAFLPYRAGD